jgi:hypothetical protein
MHAICSQEIGFMPRAARLGPVKAQQMHAITMSRGHWSGFFDHGVLLATIGVHTAVGFAGG